MAQIKMQTADIKISHNGHIEIYRNIPLELADIMLESASECGDYAVLKEN